MKPAKRPSEETAQVLLLLKLDAQRLFERIRYRRPEYMQVFSAKRTREHFPQIFRNKYAKADLSDLKNCSPEVIIGLDNFYSKADELAWYLSTTEDMPASAEETVQHFIHELDKLHENLQLYIHTEFNIAADSR